MFLSRKHKLNNMILKSIKLKNIRSYVEQKINFNKGISVLSGDIGSGKSSVLLAIEFALFGITSNDSGNGLLRKGSNEGLVELTLEINGKETTIQRTLSRKSEGIRQGNGSIIIDNSKKDLTPVELRHAIFSMLGYPTESLTKKPTIYRYTTYTPQDEMKQILFENPEERLITIRKIFGVDKYQRIIENTSTITKHLRETKKELLGKISDLETKKQELKRITDEKIVLIAKEKETNEKLIASQKELQEVKNKINVIEEEIKKTELMKKEKAILEAAIKQRQEQQTHVKKDLEILEKEIFELKQKVNPEKIEELKKKIKTNLREEITNIEKETFVMQKEIAESEASKKHSQKIKQQLNDLNDCPICLQKVSHEHKHSITSKEDEHIANHDKNLTELNNKMIELTRSTLAKKNEMQESNNAEKELSILGMQIKNIGDKEAFVAQNKIRIAKSEQEILDLIERNSRLITQNNERAEENHKLIKKELEQVTMKERLFEIEKTKITTELKNNEKIESIYNKEIVEKEHAKKKLNEISEKEQWLQNNFSNIISQMEKYVLSKIYTTINEHFKEIFAMMLDDERLVSRIDENFTPKIEQNGYETDFTNLSGGEKTSLSLAYRLALYKSLASISNLQSNGLLMLDEPTDGFSEEQIDKMKDIFDKIHANQTIIVSHENKIESIADNVIKIGKSGHESLILI